MLKTYLYFAIGLGGNYLFNIFIARSLGAFDFGIYSLALNIFNICTLMCTASLDQSLIHLTHQDHSSTERNTSRLLGTTLLLGIVTSLIGTFILVAIARNTDNPKLAETIALLSPAVICYVVSTLLIADMQAKHIISQRLFIKYIIEPAVRILSGIVMIKFGLALAAPPLAIFLGLAAITLTPFIWKKHLIGKISLSYDKTTARRILKFCAPLVASSVFTVAASRADIPIMGIFLSSKSIAFYAAALQTAAILAIILQAAETVSTSRFSAYIGNGDLPALISEYKKSTRLSLLAGIPVFIGFCCNATLIMSWFGSEFSAGAAALIILSCAQLINLATGPANPILIMSGRTQIVMANEIIYGVMVILAIYLGCRWFDFIGAAAGVAIANTLLRFIRIACVYRLFSCHPHTSYSWKLLACVIIPLLAFAIFKDKAGIWGLILYPLLSVLTALGLGLQHDDKIAAKAFLKKWNLA